MVYDVFVLLLLNYKQSSGTWCVKADRCSSAERPTTL